MQKSRAKQFIRYSFWLSILLHLLLFSLAVTIIINPNEYKKPPQLYVPSYISSGSIVPLSSRSYSKNINSPQPKKNIATKDTSATEERSPMTPQAKRAAIQTPKTVPSLFQQSVLAASLATLQQDQLKSLSRHQEEEPILLIGDTSEMADPLTRLIGRALSANFKYPETEGRLGIKGRVLVGMTLQSNGRFTDVQMIKSSDNHNLDTAALYAVNQAPAIEGADRFISKPKHLVIGFIFN